MNAFDRLLQDELNRLVDRIAARAGDETAAGLKPDLKARIDRCEGHLTELRAALLDGYAEWLRALEECEDLWTVAELRKDAPDTPARFSRRAA
jgi:hypothetical protein